MVIIHMKGIIIHKGENIASRVELLFVLSAVCGQICILAIVHVYFSCTRVCPSTIDDTHLCTCHVQDHEKIDFMNSIIPFLSIYGIFFFHHQLNVSLTDEWIIDNCFQDFIDE